MPSDLIPSLKLDLRRAVRGGLGGRAAAPTDSDVAARDAQAAAVGQRLSSLQAAGKAGFARLDGEAWCIPAVVHRAAELRALGDCLLVLGVGGSALGARAIRDALGGGAGAGTAQASGDRPFRVEVLDTLDPDFVRRVLASLDPQRTVVAAISKSGGTLETVSLTKVVQSWLEAACPSDWAQRMTFVTDPDRGAFRALAAEAGLSTLAVPADVGGRFSVLTAVGLLPAAFLGLDTSGLLAGARSLGSIADPAADPAWRYATLHDVWWQAGGRVSVLLSYREGLTAFGAWYQQLWAESLGKRRGDGEALGWTPLALRGPADQHSLLQLLQEGPSDKLVTSLRVGAASADLCIPSSESPTGALGSDLNGLALDAILRAEEAGTVAALVEDGRPVVDLNVPELNEHTLGALFGFFMRAAAYAGLLWDIDPFDQPGVEAGKRYASAMLGRQGTAAEAARLRAVLGDRD